MSEATIEGDLAATRPRGNWFRFSLRSLLLAMALVAAYFGGRASMKPLWNAPPTGTWQIQLTSGARSAVTLTSLSDGLFLLNSGGVFSGQYRWKTGKLTVVKPTDKRFMGLIWKWDDDELVLVAEPPNHPAGPAYIGARLHFVSPDTSSKTQKSVPTSPSRFSKQSQLHSR